MKKGFVDRASATSTRTAAQDRQTIGGPRPNDVKNPLCTGSEALRPAGPKDEAAIFNTCLPETGHTDDASTGMREYNAFAYAQVRMRGCDATQFGRPTSTTHRDFVLSSRKGGNENPHWCLRCSYVLVAARSPPLRCVMCSIS